jgi:hypothetical protein
MSPRTAPAIDSAVDFWSGRREFKTSHVVMNADDISIDLHLAWFGSFVTPLLIEYERRCLERIQALPDCPSHFQDFSVFFLCERMANNGKR